MMASARRRHDQDRHDARRCSRAWRCLAAEVIAAMARATPLQGSTLHRRRPQQQPLLLQLPGPRPRPTRGGRRQRRPPPASAARELALIGAGLADLDTPPAAAPRATASPPQPRSPRLPASVSAMPSSAAAPGASRLLDKRRPYGRDHRNNDNLTGSHQRPPISDLDTLKRLIKSGEIDTVLICMVDVQGRLMGKRYTGHFFLESGVKEAHTCDYLLAIDMEIEPVPGYKASSWARGYGDFVLKPDLEDAAPRALGCRAPPSSSATSSTITARSAATFAAAGPEEAGGAREEARLRRHDGGRARAVRVRRVPRVARAKDYKNLKHAGWYHRGLRHPADARRKSRSSAPSATTWMPPACPVECSKGRMGPGPGGDQPQIRRGRGDGRPHRHLQERRQGDRPPAGQGRFLHGRRSIHSLAGNSFHLHSSLWGAKNGKPMFYDKAAPNHMSELFCHYLGRPDLRPARVMAYFFAPYINSYKALLGRHLRAD